MTNALVIQPPTEMEAFRARLEAKRDLIRTQIAPGAPDDVLEFFIEQCVRLGLDPLMRQIYLIKRGTRWTPQVGIDGFRSIADRTGAYAGSDEPHFIEGHDEPSKATITVWKLVQGTRCPFTAAALMDEYRPAPGLDAQWKKMPHVMLAKVAEALALRKGFPSQLGGLYIPEEMEQADRPTPTSKPRAADVIHHPKAEAQATVIEPTTGEIIEDKPETAETMAERHRMALATAKDTIELKSAWGGFLFDAPKLTQEQVDTCIAAKDQRKAELDKKRADQRSEPF